MNCKQYSSSWDSDIHAQGLGKKSKMDQAFILVDLKSPH